MGDVILHSFNWKYTDVAARAKAIADAGYGAVLLPPPLYSDEKGESWWQRYQPKDYRVLRSYLGSKEELGQAIAALHDHGLRAYIDVVFNHMANEKAVRADPYNFPGEYQLKRYRDERASFQGDTIYGNLDHGLFCYLDFNPDGDICDWDNPHESWEHKVNGLPDLHLNDWVVDQQRTCLRALNALGADGYRIDAIKHLPEEHIRRVFQAGDLDGKYVFGEALTSSENQERLFLWPLVNSTNISLYDFPLQDTLRQAFSPGGNMRQLVDPAAYGQALSPFRALTFSITHDIALNAGFRYQMLDSQDEYLANVYLMGRDGGIPLVYSDQNESASQYPGDTNRWNSAWNRNDTRSMITFHNAVHGTPQRPLYEADGFLVFARGDKGIVAINKTLEWQHPQIWTYGIRQGRYRCTIHGYEMSISGQFFNFAIPPRQAQMWLYQEGT